MNEMNRIASTIDEMRKLNLEDERQKDEHISLMKTIPDLIINAEESGDIETCNTEKLQTALRICRKIPDVKDRWEEILEVIKLNIKQKKHIGEWIRGLAPNRIRENDIREIIESLWIRQINQYVFPALEAEADSGPYESLMDWYIAVLDRTERGERQDRIFRRLAFYYLHSTQYSENTDRAKAYLLAMERRGILPENPYGGYFGDYDHTELINSILDDSYEDKKIVLRGEYAEGLLDRVKEKGLAEEINLDDENTCMMEIGFRDLEWDDLRNIVFTIHTKLDDNKRNEEAFSQEELDAAERFLKLFSETAEYFLNNCEGNDSFNNAGTAMTRILYEIEYDDIMV